MSDEPGSVIFSQNELNTQIIPHSTVVLSGPQGDFAVKPIGKEDPISIVVDKITGSLPPNPPDKPITYIYKGGGLLRFGPSMKVTISEPAAGGGITLTDGINTAVFTVPDGTPK